MKINELKNDKIGRLMLDQDGVTANCDKGLCDFANMNLSDYLAIPRKDRGPIWVDFMSKQTEQSITDFFANLEWEPNADKLLDFLNQHSLEFEVLTRPVRPPFRDACIAGKKIWLRKHGITVPVIFEANKEKYAVDAEGRPNILVDDHPDNISKWIAKGGIGILHYSEECDKTLDTLMKIYNL